MLGGELALSLLVAISCRAYSTGSGLGKTRNFSSRGVDTYALLL